jgi:hypothetical protein
MAFLTDRHWSGHLLRDGESGVTVEIHEQRLVMVASGRNLGSSNTSTSHA